MTNQLASSHSSAQSAPRKLNKKLFIGVGVVLFLWFVLTSIPAIWGGYFLTKGTGLALSGVTGTLWNGRASLASVTHQGKEYSLGQLSWSLRGLSLLKLNPCLLLTTKLDKQTFEGDVCVGLNGAVTLKNADIALPAALVQQYIPIPIMGQLSAHMDSLVLRGNVLLKLNGKLSWRQAQVNNGANWMEIGSYGADLVDDGKNGIKATLFDLDGPVDIDLVAELKAPSGGRVQGKFVTTKSFLASANAGALLGMFAQHESEDAEGKVHYKVDVNL